MLKRLWKKNDILLAQNTQDQHRRKEDESMLD